MNLILVRATVNIAGLHVGQYATVNADAPHIIEYLEAEILVPVDHSDTVSE